MAAVKALPGIRILDLSTVIAVPYAMAWLGDMGAEVIKIEPCSRPDQRISGPFPENTAGERYWEQSGTWHMVHRSKRDLTLDLTKPQGIQVFKELVRISDVVVENNTPRVMKNFGLDYEVLRTINPGIIMLSNTGYGHTGPWRNYGTIGNVLEPVTGMTALTGYPGGPPVKSTYAYTDLPVSWSASVAVLAALHYRERTGKGQWIDLAMYEVGVAFLGEAILEYSVNGRVRERMGNRHTSMAPHGCYPCRGEEAWIVIAVATDAQWRTLCQVMEQPDLVDDPRFADVLSRWEHQDELDPMITAWTQGHDHYELARTLQDRGVAAGPVLNSGELHWDPHLKARGFFEAIQYPPDYERVGTRPIVGRPFHLSRSDGVVRSPAPVLGQDNHYVLAELLGYSGDDIGSLEQEEVIGYRPLGVGSPPKPVSLEQLKRLKRITGYDPSYREVLGLTPNPSPTAPAS